MDKRFHGPLDFLNVVRFGLFMAAEAKHVEHKGADSLGKLFEGSRPMLARR